MKIPYLCIALAGFLIYLPRFWVVRAAMSMPQGYDNHDPRGQQAQLTGIGKRAQGAHMNGFEAFAPFAAGVLVAQAAGASARWITIFAVGFVAARALYIALYLADLAWPRSTVWILGISCTACLFGLALFA